jgi:hypothetical protein
MASHDDIPGEILPIPDRKPAGLTTTSPLPAGTHQVRMEFTYDGGGMGKGAAVTLYVDGQKVGEGRVGRTHALFFSMDETTKVGGEPVSEDYGHHDTSSAGRSTGCRSISTRRPRTSTT